MEFTDLVPFRNRRRQAARAGSISPFERLHEEMDRLFDDFLPQIAGGREASLPVGVLGSVDLSESDDALELTADLPGMEEKDIDVTLRDGSLVIRGERKHEAEEKKKNYYRTERAYGAFSRTVPLPCDVEEDGVKAEFKKGVLTVRLPKSRSARENERKIAIQTA